MLVDPTGKVQTELDEQEGIAFCEIGEPGFQRVEVSHSRRLSLFRCRFAQ